MKTWLVVVMVALVPSSLFAESVAESHGLIHRVLIVTNGNGDMAATESLRKAAQSFSDDVTVFDVSETIASSAALPRANAVALRKARADVNQAATAIRARLRDCAKPVPSLVIIVGDESRVPPFVVDFTYRQQDRKVEECVFTDYPYSDLEGRGNYGPALVRLPEDAAEAVPMLERSCPPRQLQSAYICTQHSLDSYVGQVLQKKGVQSILSTRGEPARIAILGRYPLLLFQGHAGPMGYANPVGLRCNGLPELSEEPLVVLAGCSTAAPGSEMVQQFLKKGAAGVVGSTSDAHGVFDCGYWPLIHDVFARITASTRSPFPVVLNQAKCEAIRSKTCERKLQRLLHSMSAELDVKDAYHLIGILGFQYYGAPQLVLALPEKTGYERKGQQEQVR